MCSALQASIHRVAELETENRKIQVMHHTHLPSWAYLPKGQCGLIVRSACLSPVKLGLRGWPCISLRLTITFPVLPAESDTTATQVLSTLFYSSLRATLSFWAKSCCFTQWSPPLLLYSDPSASDHLQLPHPFAHFSSILSCGSIPVRSCGTTYGQYCGSLMIGCRLFAILQSHGT